MTYAVFTDIGTRLARTISDPLEQAQINAWISDAESLIATKVPNLAADILASKIDVDEAKRVVCQIVIRKVNNPEGHKDERIDDHSFGFHPDAARGDIFITDDEIAVLTPSGIAGGAFSIIPGGYRAVPANWVSPTGTG